MREPEGSSGQGSSEEEERLLRLCSLNLSLGRRQASFRTNGPGHPGLFLYEGPYENSFQQPQHDSRLRRTPNVRVEVTVARERSISTSHQREDSPDKEQSMSKIATILCPVP